MEPDKGGLKEVDRDAEVRLEPFRFLQMQSQMHPNTLQWSTLLCGFDFEGGCVPLVSQQGIFRPAVCRLPLSIRTAPMVEGRERPYEDALADGFLLYLYRGSDRTHRENEGLRIAWRERVPLVYLFGIT